mmetsp:Transcript_16800/g.43663  ORF Transcript_16800/g.43663 Transcript_16800/m.43663 type:complete len:254 (+) Transcript_16800:217-978(+)
MRATPLSRANRSISTRTAGVTPPRPPLCTEQMLPSLFTATSMWPWPQASSSAEASTTWSSPICTSETSTGNDDTSRGSVSSSNSKSTGSPVSSATTSVRFTSVHPSAARTAKPQQSKRLPPAHSRIRASTWICHARAPGMMHSARKSRVPGVCVSRLMATPRACARVSPPRCTKAGEAPAEQSTITSTLPQSGAAADGSVVTSLMPTRTSLPPSRTRAEPFVLDTTRVSTENARASPHCRPSARKFCATPSSM